MTIPTTQQIAEGNLARFESEIGQQAPLNEKAFLRVISVVEAILATALYKFGIDRAKQVLASTAFGPGLDVIGADYGVIRTQAIATGLTVTLPGVNGTIIPATVDFVGDDNGVRYRIDASATVVGGFATISLTAKQAGTVGNLNNGQTLSIGSPVAGAESTATVAATTTTGAEEETDDNYRIRVLDVIRAPGGGGNAADYRNWAQEVPGVARAYPYAGKPAALLASSAPPDRTVYVESTTAIDAEGIPPQSLLDDVRDNITTDPITGLSRQPLGLTDETLYIEPITRTAFFVRVIGLVVDPSIEATVKATLETELAAYLLSLRPFVDGVDSPVGRNDLITDVTVSNVVHDVTASFGATAQSAAFDTAPGSSIPEYQLGQGETAKLEPGGVSYV